MKIGFALRLVVLFSLIAALLSCTADGGSIYATIEKEQKINVSTLDQTLTILDIVKTPDAQFPSLVAAGAVYKGTPPDSNNEIGWPVQGKDPVAVRPPAGGALCTALANRSGVIYGAFFADGPGMGLYTAAPGPNFSFRVSDGASAIADPLVADKQITLLQVDPVNNYLFAVVANLGSSTSGFQYDLVYSTNGTTFNTTNLKNLPDKITGVALYAGAYWVTSGSTIYTATPVNLGTGLAATSTGLTLRSGEELTGVTVDGTNILIPTSLGNIFYNNGGGWAEAGTGDTVNGRQVAFLTVSTHVDISGAGVIFLIGSDGAGYYTLNVTNGSVVRFSDVTVTGLYAGAIRKMLVDVNAGITTVFMGTAGTGLWRTQFDPATGDVAPGAVWIHE